MPPLLQVDVDAERLKAEIEQLATFSETPAPSVTRILFTPTDLAGRAYVKELMADAGLSIREDPAGNIFGRWQGSGEGSIGTGSHCDAIPHAGRFDGTLGVLGAIAAVRALRTAGYTPKKSIDVIMFTSEEPTRFGIGCSGSRLMGGAITPETLDALRDDNGISFQQARTQAGYEGDLADVVLAPEQYDHFVELHIEQGPVLEANRLDIGVVSAIAAPASFTIDFRGKGGHAGAVLMPDREDALIPAGILIAAAEKLARDSASDDSVATVGIVQVAPGAVNSIPRHVHLAFDVRDTNLETRESIISELQRIAHFEADARGLSCEVNTINSDPPVTTDARVCNVVADAATAYGLGHQPMVSRAYHDSLFIARKVPTGMIFVPSAAGISHRPDEYTSPEEMANGTAVLATTLAELAL